MDLDRGRSRSSTPRTEATRCRSATFFRDGRWLPASLSRPEAQEGRRLLVAKSSSTLHERGGRSVVTSCISRTPPRREAQLLQEDGRRPLATTSGRAGRRVALRGDQRPAVGDRADRRGAADMAKKIGDALAKQPGTRANPW